MLHCSDDLPPNALELFEISAEEETSLTHPRKLRWRSKSWEEGCRYRRDYWRNKMPERFRRK